MSAASKWLRLLTQILGKRLSASAETPLMLSLSFRFKRTGYMNTDWDKAIEFVLRMEGGYTVDANDPGGETNFGISKKSYPSLDIKNLTVDEAKQIYRKDYWEPCKCDELPSPFAIGVFDCAVNQGSGKARRILQMALDIDVDGIIGDKTLSAAFKASRHQLKKMLVIRLSEYARIMAENEKLLVFANNWFNRVLSLAELIYFNGDIQ